MQRRIASLLSLCAALPGIGCAWVRGGSPESDARARQVESALAVLRQHLDLPVDALAREVDRLLPPVGENVTPAGRQLIFDHQMVWLGVHQLIGFGEDRAQIESILARLSFDEHGPYFPRRDRGPSRAGRRGALAAGHRPRRALRGRRRQRHRDARRSGADGARSLRPRERSRGSGLADRGHHLRTRSDPGMGQLARGDDLGARLHPGAAAHPRDTRTT